MLIKHTSFLPDFCCLLVPSIKEINFCTIYEILRPRCGRNLRYETLANLTYCDLAEIILT